MNPAEATTRAGRWLPDDGLPVAAVLSKAPTVVAATFASEARVWAVSNMDGSKAHT